MTRIALFRFKKGANHWAMYNTITEMRAMGLTVSPVWAGFEVWK